MGLSLGGWAIVPLSHTPWFRQALCLRQNSGKDKAIFMSDAGFSQAKMGYPRKTFQYAFWVDDLVFKSTLQKIFIVSILYSSIHHTIFRWYVLFLDGIEGILCQCGFVVGKVSDIEIEKNC